VTEGRLFDLAPDEPVDPHAVAFDPFAPAVRHDPVAAHADLREHCPFHHFEAFGEHGFYTLSRHADITEILKEPVLWTTGRGPGPEHVLRTGDGVLLNADPPVHTVQRRLVNKAFTPRAVADMEVEVQRVADSLIDDFAWRGHGDLVADFASPLPVIVIARMLGVPERDMATFKEWSDVIVAAIGGDASTHERNTAVRKEFATYFTELILEREALRDAHRLLPQDLVSGLVLADYEGRRFTHVEMLGILLQLLVAGNETTTSLITNLLHRLFEHPEERAKVEADPDALAPTAVEESLRYDAPVQGLFRTNTAPARIHGVDLDEHTKVMVLFASANHDERVWEEPRRFKVDRDYGVVRSHYAFGFGVHYYLGAPLARLEGRIALTTLLRRLPNLRPAGEPDLVAPMLFRGFARYPVAWDVPHI